MSWEVREIINNLIDVFRGFYKRRHNKKTHDKARRYALEAYSEDPVTMQNFILELQDLQDENQPLAGFSRSEYWNTLKTYFRV